MVCHCVPAPVNDRVQSRAWQLLRAAAVRHHVELIAQVDMPVHMEHWRRLNSLARRVTLVSGWPGTRAARVERAARQAMRWTAFDTVLCTSPRLWSRALRRNDCYRVLDVDVPESQLLRHRAAGVEPIMRWRLERRAWQAHVRETRSAATCDVLMVSRRDDWFRFERHAPHTALVPRHDDEALIELLSAPLATIGSTLPADDDATPLRRAA